jgi:hypothetical protein
MSVFRGRGVRLIYSSRWSAICRTTPTIRKYQSAVRGQSTSPEPLTKEPLNDESLNYELLDYEPLNEQSLNEESQNEDTPPRDSWIPKDLPMDHYRNVVASRCTFPLILWLTNSCAPACYDIP